MRIWITIYHTLLRERFVRRKLCHNDIFFKSRFNVCKVLATYQIQKNNYPGIPLRQQIKH